MGKYDFLDGERIRKAHSVKNIQPIFESLAKSLASIPNLRYIKIFPKRIVASNVLSDDGKKNKEPGCNHRKRKYHRRRVTNRCSE